jgi:hypothetical protein
VTELRHDRDRGHHERQVEQELELSRRSVWLVDGARRAGLRLGALLHDYSQSSCQE